VNRRRGPSAARSARAIARRVIPRAAVSPAAFHSLWPYRSQVKAYGRVGDSNPRVAATGSVQLRASIRDEKRDRSGGRARRHGVPGSCGYGGIARVVLLAQSASPVVTALAVVSRRTTSGRTAPHRDTRRIAKKRQWAEPSRTVRLGGAHHPAEKQKAFTFCASCLQPPRSTCVLRHEEHSAERTRLMKADSDTTTRRDADNCALVRLLEALHCWAWRQAGVSVRGT
jgi:hypothetical protein